MSSKSSRVISLKHISALRAAGTVLDLGAVHVKLQPYQKYCRVTHMDEAISRDLQSVWEEVGESIKGAFSEAESGILSR